MANTVKVLKEKKYVNSRSYTQQNSPSKAREIIIKMAKVKEDSKGSKKKGGGGKSPHKAILGFLYRNTAGQKEVTKINSKSLKGKTCDLRYSTQQDYL